MISYFVSVSNLRLVILQRLRAIFSDTSHDKTSRGNATFAVRDMAVKQLKKNQNIDPSVTNEAFVRVCRSTISGVVTKFCCCSFLLKR